MAEFLMPSLGADMDAGTILEWRVQPGDAVHRGDIVAVVDTEKSDIEVEVFEDGVVEELLVGVGQEVAVGTPLARIGAVTEAATAAPEAEAEHAQGAEEVSETSEEAEARPRRPARKPPAKESTASASASKEREAVKRPATKPKGRPPARPERPRKPTRAERTASDAAQPVAEAAAPPAATAGERVRSSPLARRRAAELGVDLSSVRGSGDGGAVVVADLASAPVPAPPVAAEAPASDVAAVQRRPASDRQLAMRQAIAELMARSKREIPHYYLATTVDLGAASAWLARENASRPIAERLLPAALLLKATALAARAVPALNGFWDGAFRAGSGVHLGVAVSLRGGGLLAPAIHDADQLTVDELMQALRDLVERARAGRLRSSEMSDPTITVTNLGDQGADEVHGVIYPPQVALVGFGRIIERPWASGGLLGVRPTVRATLAADHRATDGHEGSKLLATIDRLLQAPEAL
jgi:pyruvate dehydrogenase E2 component (dihydrolipoamide acetyltransferase)